MTDTSPEAVERFSPVLEGEGTDTGPLLIMEQDELGVYVRYDSYRALSARVAELEASNLRLEVLNGNYRKDMQAFEKYANTARADALRDAAEVARVRVKICEQEERRDADSIGASCRLEADLIRRRILALLEKDTPT